MGLIDGIRTNERLSMLATHLLVSVMLVCLASLLIQFGQRLAPCLLYTSDAADERSSVDLGGRRIIKKKRKRKKKKKRSKKKKTSKEHNKI